MASHEFMALNEATDELMAPQGADGYIANKPAHFNDVVTMASTLNGRNLAADAALLDSAMQPGDLGSAATADAADFATAAQGVLADSATQPGDALSTLVNDILASQAEAEAGVENTKIMTALRVAQALAASTAGIKNNYAGLAAPTSTDDSSDGYGIGSSWVDMSTDEAYRCLDATVNLAVWVKTTLSTDELATVALTGNSDDLTEGAVKLLLTVYERALIASAVQPTSINTRTLGITAFASGGQTNAILLTTEYNVVNTVAAAGDSVKLPPAVGGLRVVVFNRGANALALFPNTSDVIEALAVDTSISVAAAGKIALFCTDDTIWYEE
jgi:hypothetical protein